MGWIRSRWAGPVFWVAALGLFSPAFAADQSVVLQQGLNGCTGVRDTWISTEDWDTPAQHTVNYGQNQELYLSRDDGNCPLMRFDLSAIPANSAVTSAYLSLYNTSPSSYSGTQSFTRRIKLFAVLRDWDEGNQVSSPIDAAGKHGATGDRAFDYYPGQGTDVAWGARGMAAGIDFAEAFESCADVVDEGWYSWDVTELVRSWVRAELANYGMVLRDATGYEDDHLDWRAFVSSQAAGDATRRPRLTVVYNPDVPFADAGADQINYQWNGGAVTLDGSGSYDRPGGNTGTLSYTWRVRQAAYGSAMNGQTLAHTRVASFTPDRAGEWEIELSVANSLGETATDTVHLQLLRISGSHPRIYLTPSRLAQLQAEAASASPRWVQLKDEADEADGEMHAKALVAVVSGQSSYCAAAVSAAEDMIADPADHSMKAGDIALIYDWCHAQLSTAQRTAFIDYLNGWGDDTPKSEDAPGWGNYWPRYGYSYALMGLATYGENARAADWLEEYRHRRYRDNDLGLLDRIAQGGGWPEGMIYDWIANWPRVKAVEAWATAAGEDLFESTGWFRQRLNYILLHRWPGIAEQWGEDYHPYVSTGDTERNRGTMANYERIMALILVGRFPDDAPARQLQACLATAPADNSMSFLYHEEFLWFDPDRSQAAPGPLTHYARGTGTVFLRSGWPDGAADRDPSPTYLTFQCGDHFTYHQHYDQNSFTLFKHGDLAVDSGVYSGDGLSYHDINYYVRTIAHNTLVVYNPAEDFSAARPDASSNDGGQRTLYPASRSPQTIEYFDQHAVHYDTGDITRFQDDAAFTYVLGDATKAYNNPAYHQAMDAGLGGNTAKVKRFQRELVYLRPAAASGADFVVLLDRVGVTSASFSGANTKLLFHTLGEPVVTGSCTAVSAGETLYASPGQATAVSGSGRLFIKTLLPTAFNLRKVGGRAVKAFWVFDGNYDWQWDGGEPQPRPINDFEDTPYGEWRLELEPADTALDHNFLTVLHPTGSSTAAMPPTTLVAGAGVAGAHIADPSLNRLVLFSSALDGSPPVGTITYTCPSTARTLHLLCDLTAGSRFRLAAAQDGGSTRLTVTPDASGPYQASSQGVLSFTVDGPVFAPGSFLPALYLLLLGE